MFSSKKPEELAKKFFEAFPPALKTLNQDTQDQLRQLMECWFAKMSLVTREEFDIQTEVLAKTRLKLEGLEAQLAILEKKLSTEDAATLSASDEHPT